MTLKHAPVFLALLGLAAAATGQEWQHRAASGTVTLSANPLPVAARTAFYTARGFAAETIAPYAAACGFSLSLRNEGRAPIRFRLDEWVAVQGSQRIRLRLPAEWDGQWQQAAVPQPARIAFRWAQFPPEQEFAPGDWIMGIASLERRLEGRFHLVARYHDHKGSHGLILEDLACAALD